VSSPPLVLLHGYSDSARSMGVWSARLGAMGFDVTTAGSASFRTLSNEITIRDLAEGLDRALLARGLGPGDPFDVVAHSTGALVLRAWMAADPARAARVRRFVALAPATFGSPLAHRGRGWLGAIFRGNRHPGPDFAEAGTEILDALELGSAFTWELAHRDLVRPPGPEASAPPGPWTFVFVGTEGYRGVRRFVSPEATDGAVRWAGCAMDTRKVSIDLTLGAREPRLTRFPGRYPADAPTEFVEGVDHGSILKAPPPALVERVAAALRVDSVAALGVWRAAGATGQRALRDALPRWQQFVVRVLDERGDPVPDYNIELRSGTGRSQTEFEMQVHSYRRDPSLRAFHVNLDRLAPARLDALQLRVVAPPPSPLLAYHGVGSERITPDGRLRRAAGVDAALDLDPVLRSGDFSLFHPFTTTLLEIRLDREPLPLSGMPRLFHLG
jgi:hypothetical protein